VGLGLTGDNPLEHVGQPRHRIDVIKFCGLDQGHRDRPMPRPTVGPGVALRLTVRIAMNLTQRSS
jgi:hypothetical protein